MHASVHHHLISSLSSHFTLLVKYLIPGLSVLAYSQPSYAYLLQTSCAMTSILGLHCLLRRSYFNRIGLNAPVGSKISASQNSVHKISPMNNNKKNGAQK